MRSSKSRSRSKQNRNRPSGGNIVNRVFDSSGPEGKVRGTPQQIIDKYNQLARDAQLSGDRVATENFQQHAEHYTRMLAEAQREMDQRREQQEQQHRERQQQHNDSRSDRDDQQGGRGDKGNQGGQGNQGHQGNQGGQGHQNDRQDRGDGNDRRNRPASPAQGDGPQPDVGPAKIVGDVIDVDDGSDSGLVETPESKPEPKPERKPRTRRPRKAEPKADAAPEAGKSGEDQSPGPAEAAE